MTRILCDLMWRGSYCKHRDSSGECTKQTVHIHNNEPYCQDYESGEPDRFHGSVVVGEKKVEY